MRIGSSGDRAIGSSEEIRLRRCTGLIRSTFDPQKVYFRAEEQARGVVPLPKQDSTDHAAKLPEVLDKVNQLCQAMRPTSIAEKLSALNQLAASGDPILSHEAEEAMRALQQPRE